MALEDAFTGEGEWVETTDEEGVIHYFEKLQELEVDGTEYALLIYHGTKEDLQAKTEADEAASNGNGQGASDKSDKEDDDESDAEDEQAEEIILMRMVMEDNTYVYESIEDSDEFDKVLQHLETMGFDALEFDSEEDEASDDDDDDADGDNK